LRATTLRGEISDERLSACIPFHADTQVANESWTYGGLA
jgi:hypothetical protein